MTRLPLLKRLFHWHSECEDPDLCEERSRLEERERRLKDLEQERLLNDELRRHRHLFQDRDNEN